MTCSYCSCWGKQKWITAGFSYRGIVRKKLIASLSCFKVQINCCCRNQPFQFYAADNVTSGHSDSWHTPCQVPLLSPVKLAMCALKIKQIYFISSHTLKKLHIVIKQHTTDRWCVRYLFTLTVSLFLYFNIIHKN